MMKKEVILVLFLQILKEMITLTYEEVTINGQLGIGETTDYWTDKPIQIKFDIEYTDIKFLSTNDSFGMVVLTGESSNDFNITWGLINSEGQLGPGGSIDMTDVPTLVTELAEYDEIKFIDMELNLLKK